MDKSYFTYQNRKGLAPFTQRSPKAWIGFATLHSEDMKMKYATRKMKKKELMTDLSKKK